MSDFPVPKLPNLPRATSNVPNLPLPIPNSTTSNLSPFLNLPQPTGVPDLSSTPDFSEIIQRKKEQQENERKYVHEFDILSWKMATNMEDLTPEEITIWKDWLKYHVGKNTFIPEDLFSRSEYWDGYEKEVQVRYWSWTHDGQVDTLIDINGWPGDNECGPIIMNGQIVFENSDQDLFSTEFTSEELKLRKDALRHIRIFWCREEADYDDNSPEHEHCEQVYKRLKQIKGEKQYFNVPYEDLILNLQMGAYKFWEVSEFPSKNPKNTKLLFSFYPEGDPEYISEVYFDTETEQIYAPY